MKLRAYLVPSLDHGEGVQYEADGGPSQGTSKQIAVGSQFWESRRRV